MMEDFSSNILENVTTENHRPQTTLSLIEYGSINIHLCSSNSQQCKKGAGKKPAIEDGDLELQGLRKSLSRGIRLLRKHKKEYELNADDRALFVVEEDRRSRIKTS